jgi:predicted CXXCH cytochrome family protein
MMNTKRNYAMLRALALFLVILSPGVLYSKSMQESSHGDRRKLPRGCASCHVGHGNPGTAMLSEKKELFCFKCHGHQKNTDETRRKGDLGRQTKAADLQREFEKAYHHPIERTGIHRFNENLPETDPSKERHSECGDCHHHHYVTEKNKVAGMRWTSMNKGKVQEVMFEYELCFNCHLNSANLPSEQIGKMDRFDVTSASFHPVEAQGKNKDVPSLMPPLTAASLIKCTDCHNNDDPRGPKGPHGSKYRYLLARNYTATDGGEGPLQYELCYGCHRRSSILGNESFQYHNLHISSAGTSCKTCHDSHGSAHHPHLIDFDSSSVRPSKSGRLDFIVLGRKAGQCYLNCHGKDHDPAQYPAAPPKTLDKRTPAGAPIPGTFDPRKLR